MSDLDAFFGVTPKAPSGGQYASLIADAETRHGIPPGLLHAVITVGERSGERAVSPKGAMGLAQLMPGTAREVGVKDPMDPAQSIEGGAKYLSQQLAKHNGDPRLAVAAYNAGPGAVAKYKGVPPFRETQDYVARVVGPGGYQMQDDVDAFFGTAPQVKAAAAQGSSAQFLQGVGAAPGQAAPQDQQSASQKFLSDIGETKASKPGKVIVGPEVNALPINAETGVGLPAAQARAFRQLAAGGGIDINAQVGTAKLPYVQVKPGVVPSGPGVYYVDLEGKLQQTHGEPVGKAEALGAGFVQGARDVNASINNLAGFVDERVPVSKGLNQLLGFDAEKSKAQDYVNREGFESRYQDQAYGTGGRIAGQVAASAPIMLAGGEVAAPLLRGSGAVGEFVAGRAGGNLLTQTASRATQGAIQGAEGAALTSGQSDRPLAEQVGTGALVGGVAGPVVPAVLGAAGNVVNKVTQSPVATEVADLARVAMDKWKIPLRSSQIAGTADRAAAITDSNLIGATGSGYGRSATEQGRRFTQAVSNTIGEDTDKITPEVMAAAKRRIGGTMNDIAAKTTIKVDDQMLNELAAVGSQAREIGLESGQIKGLDAQIEKILDYAASHDGNITGEAYQTIVGHKSSLQRMQSNGQGAVRDLANDIREAIDGGLERSAPRDVRDALTRARYEYKNLKTIEDLAEKAGPDGQISPAQLLGRVRAKFDNFAYGGGGDLGELARIGQTFLKEPPQSGTAPRLMEMIKRNALGGGLLAGAGGAQLLNQPEIAGKMLLAGGVAQGLRLGNNAFQGALNNNAPLTNRLLSSQTGAVASPLARLLSSPQAKIAGQTLDTLSLPVAAIGGNRLAQPSR